MSTVATMNGVDTISGRIKQISTTGFDYYFREQEKNPNKHVKETIHYIAWEPGEGSLGEMQYRVAVTSNAVTDTWYKIIFPIPCIAAPLFLAEMQTTEDVDNSALRTQNLTASGLEIKVEEEQSKDSEVSHSAETVGYIALSQKAETVLATFTWELDTVQESTISGFQILVNGEVICTSDDPTARQLSCGIAQPTWQTGFTIRAIEITGDASEASNSLTYIP